MSSAVNSRSSLSIRGANWLHSSSLKSFNSTTVNLSLCPSRGNQVNDANQTVRHQPVKFRGNLAFELAARKFDHGVIKWNYRINL